MSWSSIETLVHDVQSQKVSAVELVERAQQAIAKTKDYNIVLAENADAHAIAQKIDTEVAAGKTVGRLAGIPYIAKDNYLSKGIETTASSNILKGFIPPFNATVIEKLASEGAILIAKSNLDAFAHGGSTENSDFGPTKNPHNDAYVPGGSSGGSAAAVALDLVPFALGSDTGGSIRQPASFTGTVGLKPTYGLVSRYGVVAMASSTDVMGPITKTVADAALVMDVISGRDLKDATSIERDQQDYSQLDTTIKGKTFGVIKEHLAADGIDTSVQRLVTTAIDAIQAAGGVIKEVSIPELANALAVYYIVMPAEVSSNLGRYDGIRYGLSVDKDDLDEHYETTRSHGFNSENKRRILMGTYVLSSGYYDAYYKKAQQVRTLLINRFTEAFNDVDFLIGPTTPTPAFKIGDIQDPLTMYLNDIMTVGASLVGNPAINIPVGKAGELPVGMQIMAAQRHDHNLLGVAAGVEQHIGYK